MFLKNFVYANWGNIPATEFEFGPINLLSGGNGSGKLSKTTLALSQAQSSAVDFGFMLSVVMIFQKGSSICVMGYSTERVLQEAGPEKQMLGYAPYTSLASRISNGIPRSTRNTCKPLMVILTNGCASE